MNIFGRKTKTQFEYDLLKKEYEKQVKVNKQLLARCEVAERFKNDYEELCKQMKEKQKEMDKQMKKVKDLEVSFKEYINSVKADLDKNK